MIAPIGFETLDIKINAYDLTKAYGELFEKIANVEADF
jgi:hypothetical protein